MRLSDTQRIEILLTENGHLTEIAENKLVGKFRVRYGKMHKP